MINSPQNSFSTWWQLPFELCFQIPKIRTPQVIFVVGGSVSFSSSFYLLGLRPVSVWNFAGEGRSILKWGVTILQMGLRLPPVFYI